MDREGNRIMRALVVLCVGEFENEREEQMGGFFPRVFCFLLLSICIDIYRLNWRLTGG